MIESGLFCRSDASGQGDSPSSTPGHEPGHSMTHARQWLLLITTYLGTPPAAVCPSRLFSLQCYLHKSKKSTENRVLSKVHTIRVVYFDTISRLMTGHDLHASCFPFESFVLSLGSSCRVGRFTTTWSSPSTCGMGPSSSQTDLAYSISLHTC